MQRGSMTDREAYPTAWITLAVLVLLYLLWRFALGAPTVSRCWVWEHWHVYCPGCGGTRALMALAQGRMGAALWYHTPVVITLALAAICFLKPRGGCWESGAGSCAMTAAGRWS